MPRPSSRPPTPRNQHERLTEVVRQFHGRRPVVLGDLVADEFVYGDIARVSREAPVLILEHRTTRVVPGGGGNTVANLRALGADPLPVGIVGDDESGHRLLSAFSEMNVDTSGILVRSDYVTPSKSRILAGGVHTRRQQVVRIDRGAPSAALGRVASQGLDRALRQALRHGDGLLVADYGYGAATPQRAEAARDRLGDRPLLVDSRTRVTDYRDASACTPNQEELERALGSEPLTDGGEVEAAGRRLMRRTGNRMVLVTQGARGMTLFERGRKCLRVPAFGSDEVADVTGAGDTVIAVFGLALLVGASGADAARLANCAAGLVVMKLGTSTITPAELVPQLAELET